jgi:hypothetical protein
MRRGAFHCKEVVSNPQAVRRHFQGKGCFSVNSMRESADLPKARQIMVANGMKAHQLLIDNLTAARGSRDEIMILSLA